MINDRGRIKWSPFLIPEHKKRIAQLYEAEDDIQQPDLDEQMLDTLQETISSAIEYHQEVTITYHHSKRNKNICGLIRKVDPYTRMIIIDSLDVNGQTFNIPLQLIINIKIGR